MQSRHGPPAVIPASFSRAPILTSLAILGMLASSSTPCAEPPEPLPAAPSQKVRQEQELHRQTLPDGHALTSSVISGLDALRERQARQALEHDDFATAEKAWNEVLSLRRAQWGDNNYRVTDARLALAQTERMAHLTPQDRQRVKDAERLLTAALRAPPAEAVASVRKVLEVQQQIFGEKHPDTAVLYHALGILLWRQRDYPAARAHYEKALAIRREVLGEKHPDTAASLNNLGVTLAALGDQSQARASYEKALAIRLEVLGEKHADTAQTISNLGYVRFVQRDYAAALPFFERALAIRREVLGEKHDSTAESLTNLGMLKRIRGEYAEARSYYEQALAIHKTNSGEKSAATAAVLSNLGVLFYDMGDFVAARWYDEQVLAIRRAVLGETHAATAQALHNLGALLWKQGDYLAAKSYFEQALAMYRVTMGEKNLWNASTINCLGYVAFDQGDYAAARSYFEKAVALSREVSGGKDPDLSRYLGNLAMLLTEQGDFAAARRNAKEAIAVSRAILGEKHPSYASALRRMAALLLEEGDLAAAQSYCDQALALSREALGEKHPDVARLLSSQGVLRARQGDYAGARVKMEQALRIARENIDLTAATQSERQQLAMAEALGFLLNRYLSVVVDGGLPADPAYTHVLAWKGAVLARQRWSHLARTLGNTDVARSFQELESVSTHLATLAMSTPEPSQRDRWRRQVADHTRRKEELEAEISHRSAEFRQQKAGQRRSAADLQAALPENAALIDFVVFAHQLSERRGKSGETDHLAAFVLRHSGPLALVDLGPVAGLEAAIDRWRQKLQRTAPVLGPDDPAVALRRRLWEPLEKHLADTTLVLISPDGPLNRLPFAALPGAAADRYLVEERAIGVLPVPQLLPDLVAREIAAPPAAPSMLLVGEVDYDAAAGPTEAGRIAQLAPHNRSGQPMHWQALGNTRQEIVSIRDSFDERFPDGRCKLLRKEQAAATVVRAQIKDYRYVHFATHGFFAPPDVEQAPAAASPARSGDQFSARQEMIGFHPGLLSGLVLAGANRPARPGQDDGILTALEVAHLDLSRVDLATLSACETGLGKSAAGEGLLGLQRAFQVAGARSVVATLWTIDDAAGRQLMIEFYENLWAKKMSRVEALREAQLTMLREGVKRGLDLTAWPADQRRRVPPFYWAGFVLSGDWR